MSLFQNQNMLRHFLQMPLKALEIYFLSCILVSFSIALEPVAK